MLMLQALNAFLYIVGAMMAFLAKWGGWMKEQPKGTPRWIYLHDKLGDHIISGAVVVCVMVLWFTGNLGWVAKEFSDVLPSSLSFGDQIQISAGSSFVAGLVAELAAPAVFRWVLSLLSKIPGFREASGKEDA